MASLGTGRLVRALALLIGVSLPLAETARRWGHFGYPPEYLDDWAIGALLVAGWWWTRRDSARGWRMMSAAWGFACGMGFVSFFSHLAHMDEPDVSGWPHPALTAVLGAGWLASIAACAASVARGGGGPRGEGIVGSGSAGRPPERSGAS